MKNVATLIVSLFIFISLFSCSSEQENKQVVEATAQEEVHKPVMVRLSDGAVISLSGEIEQFPDSSKVWVATNLNGANNPWFLWGGKQEENDDSYNVINGTGCHFNVKMGYVINPKKDDKKRILELEARVKRLEEALQSSKNLAKK